MGLFLSSYKTLFTLLKEITFYLWAYFSSTLWAVYLNSAPSDLKGPSSVLGLSDSLQESQEAHNLVGRNLQGLKRGSYESVNKQKRESKVDESIISQEELIRRWFFHVLGGLHFQNDSIQQSSSSQFLGSIESKCWLLHVPSEAHLLEKGEQPTQDLKYGKRPLLATGRLMFWNEWSSNIWH